jgi:DNA repair exonuclease SbcCD ATPase subunit
MIPFATLFGIFAKKSILPILLAGSLVLILGGGFLYIRHLNHTIDRQRSEIARIEVVNKIQESTIKNLEEQSRRIAESLRRSQENIRKIENSTMNIRQDLRAEILQIERLLRENPQEASRRANEISRRVLNELREAGR